MIPRDYRESSIGIMIFFPRAWGVTGIPFRISSKKKNCKGKAAVVKKSYEMGGLGGVTQIGRNECPTRDGRRNGLKGRVLLEEKVY